MSGITGGNLEFLSVTGKTSQIQKESSFYGRLVSAIYTGGSFITQSIKSVAQSILSKCIQIGLLSQYTLENLKSYLFTKQGFLEDKLSNKDTGIPPPPPLPNAVTTRTSITPPKDSIRMSVPPPPPPIETTTEMIYTNRQQNNMDCESSILEGSMEKEVQIDSKTSSLLGTRTVPVLEKVAVTGSNSRVQEKISTGTHQKPGKKLSFLEELSNTLHKIKKKSSETE